MKKTILKTIGMMTLALLMLMVFAQISVSAQEKANKKMWQRAARTPENRKAYGTFR